mmetsp:Transcript_15389/g.23843  ORF Transcript_15389/g.23843 Transcript_15389/m.23843 type:complete len:341 (-) Transcript_15389:233-1255(-)
MCRTEKATQGNRTSKDVKYKNETAASKDCSSLRYCSGMAMASIFSLTYVVAPVWMFVAVIYLIKSPFSQDAWLFALPVFLSMIIDPPQMPWILNHMAPVLDYFQYEDIMETSNDEIFDMVNNKKKRILFAATPHGVFSYGALCRAIAEPYEMKVLKTAVAPGVQYVPFVRNIVGIFGFVSASAASLKRNFRNEGIAGCVVLYVGGMAELFQSSRDEERLYLSKRKGFIKLALREGVEVFPVYFFGNTSALSILKGPLLTFLSRRLQISVTIIWGRFGLPIPRDDKIMCVIGRPLGIPHIENPSDADVNRWHSKYCSEVKRIFDKYKEKAPLYKNKELYIT